MDIRMHLNNAADSASPEQTSIAEATIGPDAPGPDAVLDITAETCPMTFVRTRLALDAMASGQTLLVLLRGAEPRLRVPQTARSLGHAVLAQHDAPDGTTRLLLRRA